MSTILVCPEGHQWELPPGQPPPSGDEITFCPVCGILVSSAAPIGPETVNSIEPSPCGGGLLDSTAEPPSGATICQGKSLSADSAAQARGTLQGGERFTVLKLHARGGLGRVSLARDDTLGRTVALKEIDPEAADDPDSRQRFLNEAALTAQVEHPGVVPIYSLGQDPLGRPFYAMKFVHGRTLGAAIAAYRGAPTPLAFRDLLRRFVDVCLAIAFAHSRGVIHRDLKPANVMLGDYGETQVLDWGLAKRVQPLRGSQGEQTAEQEGATEGLVPTDEGLTLAGQVMGTPAYMSPEQAEGDVQAVGPATDIYALGAILYELLSGQAPYVGQSLEVLNQVQEGPPKPLAQIGHQIPRALEAVCDKAMARQPASRYANAAALAREVERWLADEPVEAYREPWHARLGRWTRRHRTFVAASAALLLTAVAALSVSTVLIGREQGRTEQALEQARAKEAEARENFRLAREAVDEYCTRVSEQRLLHQPGMEGLRRELLRSAQVYYQQFVRQQGQDAEVRLGLARAYHRLALLSSDMDSASEAFSLFQQAVDILAQLAEDDPANPGYRNELGNSYNGLSVALTKFGHQKEAQAAAQKAFVLWQDLVRDCPKDETYQHNLAISYFHQGLAQATAGQADEAEKLFHQAQALEEQLLKEHPTSRAQKNQLAIILNSLGILYRDHERFTEAEAAHKRAAALRLELVGAAPQDTEYRSYLAQSHNNLGSLYWERGQLDQARTALGKARELYEELAREHSQIFSYQENLASVLINLAVLGPASGQVGETEVLLQKALEIWERLTRVHPTVADYQHGLADCRLQRGDVFKETPQAGRCLAEYGQATAILERLAKADPKNPMYRWDLARSHLNVTDFYRAAGQPDRAGDEYRKCISLVQILLQEEPKKLIYRWALAQCYFDLGSLADAAGKPERAAGEFRQALTLLEPLARENAHRPHLVTRLGQCYYNLGRQLAKGEPEKALNCYSQAIRTLEAVLRKDARQEDARNCLSKAHENRSRILLGQEHAKEALAEVDQALTLAAGSRRDGLRLLRVITLTLLGKHAEASEEAEKLAGPAGVPGSTLQTLASVLALCSTAAAKDAGLPERERTRLGDAYAARSIALFRKAQAAGYFKSLEQIDALRTDPDLVGLQQRAEFKKWLAELEQKR